MKSMDIEQYLFVEDSVMEDCLLELPPFGAFPMRGFRKKNRNDLFLDAKAEKPLSENFPRRPGNIAA